MSIFLKGVLCIPIPATGSWAFHWFFDNYIDTSMPVFISLKNPTENKFGELYYLYLSDPENEKWWKWSYLNRLRPEQLKKNNDLSGAFKTLESHNKLKDKCKEIYEKTEAELTDTESSKDHKAKKVRDTWRYCSVFYEKPRTIEENKEGSDKDNLEDTGEYRHKYGEDKKTELISVMDDLIDNEKFWEMREKEFFGIVNKDGDGNYDISEKPKLHNRNIFNSLYDNRIFDYRDTIKETCAKAYKLDGSKARLTTVPPKPTQDEVVKYCGLKKFKKPQPAQASSRPTPAVVS